MRKEDFANSKEIFKQGHLVLSGILETYESETILFNDKKEWRVNEFWKAWKDRLLDPGNWGWSECHY